MHSASPLSLFSSFCRHASLFRQMLVREVLGRYRGSWLGIGWSFIQPLIMLAVYSFVFGIVLNARWGTGTATDAPMGAFAVMLFTGLTAHALLAECLNRSPSIIINYSNFVKKVVFPLEILTPVVIGAAAFHYIASVAVLLAGIALVHHAIPWTALLLPVIVIPFLLLLTGLGWALAAFGVFMRDITQLTGVTTTILLFFSPVFYAAETLPAAMRPLLYLNPLSFVVEQMRAILLQGQLPNWSGLLLYTAAALAVAAAGFGLFQKARPAFADSL